MIIIIFGAAILPSGRASPTLHGRVDAAFRCGGVTAHYMPTGGVGRYGPSEASVMAAILRGFGVPPDHITLEETATDTLSSAIACVRLLPAHPGAVRIVSSGYHLPRCAMLMRAVGIRTTPCPPPPRERRVWYWRLRECLAYPYDVLAITGSLLTGRASRIRTKPS